MHMELVRGMRIIKSAVITGPTGAIGMALCRLLVKNNVKVYGVVRPDSLRKEQLRQIHGVEVVECDVSQIEKLPNLIPPVNVFFHLAWGYTVGFGRNDMDAQIRNIQYTIDAVRAAKNLDCKVFLGAGSQAEYGRVDKKLAPDTPCFPENGYGMAKLCVGQMSRTECAKLGIEHIWPRILSVYGPYDPDRTMIMSTIIRLLRGEKPSLTAGEQMWDFLYSDDAAEALYRLALYGRDGCIYPVGSGQAHPLREYIEIIRDAINPSLLLGFGEIPYGEKQVMHLEADISALKKDTGFEPQVDFETGIRKTIRFVREAYRIEQNPSDAFKEIYPAKNSKK